MGNLLPQQMKKITELGNKGYSVSRIRETLFCPTCKWEHKQGEVWKPPECRELTVKIRNILGYKSWEDYNLDQKNRMKMSRRNKDKNMSKVEHILVCHGCGEVYDMRGNILGNMNDVSSRYFNKNFVAHPESCKGHVSSDNYCKERKNDIIKEKWKDEMTKCGFFGIHLVEEQEHDAENCVICEECPCTTNGANKDHEDETTFWRNAELSQGTRIEEINKRECKYLHYINGESICGNPKYEVCFRICGYSPEIGMLETSCRHCDVFIEN